MVILLAKHATKIGLVGVLPVALPLVGVGSLLILIAILMLNFMTKDVVEEYRAMKQAKATVTTIKTDTVIAGNSGKHIFTKGIVSSDETLRDTLFNIELDSALKLTSYTLYYQWHEYDTIINLDPNDTTTHHYVEDSTKQRREYYYRIESSTMEKMSTFYNDSTKRNKIDTVYEKVYHVTDQALVGAFTVDKKVVAHIAANDTFQFPLDYTGPKIKGRTAQVHNNTLFYGNDPENPEYGDFRIVVTSAQDSYVSMLVRQRKASLVPYKLSSGRDVTMVDEGHKSLEEMVLWQNIRNGIGLSLIVLVTALLMKAGMYLLIKPLRIILFLFQPENFLVWMFIDKILSWGIFLAILIPNLKVLF